MRRPLTAAALTVLVLAACSSSDDDQGAGDASATAPEPPTETVAATTTVADATTTSLLATTTAAASTTTEAPADPLALAAPGPHPVGVTRLALPAGNEVVVSYPAVPGTTGEFTYDIRDYNSEEVRALLTAEVPATFTIAAGLDAPAAEGVHPVALYSHGFSGINVGSSFLTSHLASWGVVVAAPEHPARDLAAATGFQLGDQATAVDELLATVELLRSEGERSGSPLEGRVDPERVVAIGHSAGGGTVLTAAADDRIHAYVSLASGALGRRDTTSSTTVAPPVLPAKPSLFVAGRVDAVVPWDTVTKPAFDAAPAPSLLWVIDGVGHNGFDDFCTFGNGTGIIGVAEASGLGPFLDANPQFRALGEDGCLPPAVPVEQAWPVIRQVVTAFTVEQLGIESGLPAAELGPSVADRYDPAVTVEQK